MRLGEVKEEVEVDEEEVIEDAEVVAAEKVGEGVAEQPREASSAKTALEGTKGVLNICK